MNLSMPGGGFPVTAMTQIPAWTPISEILKKPRERRTEIQARIAGALGWIGQATIALSTAVRTVALITAWEALFILCHESKGKRAKLCERVSWVVGNNSTDRATAVANIDRLYRQRSTCLHSGQPFVDPETLKLARAIVCDSVIKLVTDQRFASFKTLAELVAWINSQVAAANSN